MRLRHYLRVNLRSVGKRYHSATVSSHCVTLPGLVAHVPAVAAVLWGLHRCFEPRCSPGVIAVIASNPSPVYPGLSINDEVTLYFTQPTNRPEASTTVAVQKLVAITPQLASVMKVGPRCQWHGV